MQLWGGSGLGLLYAVRQKVFGWKWSFPERVLTFYNSAWDFRTIGLWEQWTKGQKVHWDRGKLGHWDFGNIWILEIRLWNHWKGNSWRHPEFPGQLIALLLGAQWSEIWCASLVARVSLLAPVGCIYCKAKW